jgi:hypothetical protein
MAAELPSECTGTDFVFPPGTLRVELDREEMPRLITTIWGVKGPVRRAPEPPQDAGGPSEGESLCPQPDKPFPALAREVLAWCVKVLAPVSDRTVDEIEIHFRGRSPWRDIASLEVLAKAFEQFGSHLGDSQSGQSTMYALLMSLAMSGQAPPERPPGVCEEKIQEILDWFRSPDAITRRLDRSAELRERMSPGRLGPLRVRLAELVDENGTWKENDEFDAQDLIASSTPIIAKCANSEMGMLVFRDLPRDDREGKTGPRVALTDHGNDLRLVKSRQEDVLGHTALVVEYDSDDDLRRLGGLIQGEKGEIEFQLSEELQALGSE